VKGILQEKHAKVSRKEMDVEGETFAVRLERQAEGGRKSKRLPANGRTRKVLRLRNA
jgi:hypothetical protein